MKQNSVFAAVRDAAFKHKLLSVGTVLSISHRVYEKLGGRVIEIKALDEGE